jgi:transposase-like protein
MGTGYATEQFKQNAVAQITESGSPIKLVSEQMGGSLDALSAGSACPGSGSMRGPQGCRQSSSNGGGRRDMKAARKPGAIQAPPAASQTPPCPRSPGSSEALWQAPRFLRAEG